jgi:uncharacterized protein (TIGR00369 family)
MNALVVGLLDQAMADAARGRASVGREVVTVDIHVSFLGPATGRLSASGRATGGGRSVCFCEAEVIDADGRLVATGMGTFRYGDVLP